MYTQESLQLAPVTKAVCRPRGINVLQILFKKYFQSIADRYEDKHAIIYGRFRIERIIEVVGKFVLCGDYSKGVARIQCTNPDCKYEYFRPFSCKSFYFCPSCSQKRTLLFSEYMNERLLLALPHCQFVSTFPKLLRPYFRHNCRLFSEITQLIFAILKRFCAKAAKRPVRTAMVLAYQTSGEFLRWNPHFHCLVLEGGFDERGKFVHIPLGDIQRMSEYFRRVVIKFFLKFGNAVLKDLKEKGYRTFPINPHGESIEGERCYPNLSALPERPDGVITMVPPATTAEVVKRASAAGIKCVWMQQGSESEAAIRYYRDNGMTVVDGMPIVALPLSEPGVSP